jgi:hypothetical protein
MADPQLSPEAPASDPPEAEVRPDFSDPAPEPRSRQSVDPKAAEASREERRKAHFERALKAAGKAPAETADESEDEPTETAEADGDKDEAEETDEQKSERLSKLDKLKSHKHLAKAKEKLTEEVKALDKRERDLEKQRAQDQRINDAVTKEYAPMAQARADYAKKDYRTSKAAVEHLFGDKFENIARNFWNASKDGLATADLQYKVKELEEKLSKTVEQTTKEKEIEQKTAESRQLRATFDKALKAHPLLVAGDPELTQKAFDKWHDSWDEDLEEYSLSKKKAADQVYQTELERAQRLTGKRARPATRETPERRESSTKPLREMSREEKRKHHLERALRQTGAARRDRERHA